MTGYNVLRDPLSNRGRRFPKAQRKQHGIVGLVPSGRARSLQEEISRLMDKLKPLPTLTKYEMLMGVLDRDEQLFFAMTQNNLPDVLPMIYTPAVGDACLNYSDLELPMRGVWIGIDQKGEVRQALDNWGEGAEVIVVSDCERILGLGDLGAQGMGIPVGKLLLYTACGGIDPKRCLPIVLDVGCDRKEIRESDNYIGLNQERVRGEQYDQFVDEFIKAVVDKYGRSCLIQFEDFGNSNALRLLDKYRNEVCCFNDDIQGTASVGLAGILSALKIEGVPSSLRDHRFVFLGAGSAGIGIGMLIVLALVREGVPAEEARKQIWFIDSKGLVYAGRERVSDAKRQFAHEASDKLKEVANAGLLEVIKVIKPTALVGVSTIRGSFSEDVLREMAVMNERPIIFALSNPTSKAECTAEEAYQFTDGRAIYASGSPFAAVTLPNRDTKLVPGQGNNSYIFPGLGLGIVLAGARSVPDSMLLTAADALAKLVDDEQLAVSCVYPDVTSLMDISAHIAYAVCQEAKALKLNEKPVDHLDFKKIREMMYEPARGKM